MLLVKKEENNIVECLYSSSNILKSIYNTKSNELTIIFGSSRSYTYYGVFFDVYILFENAESQGKIFNTYIKQHESIRNNDVDADVIRKEIITYLNNA